MKLKFSKMHGLGNDFIVIDGVRQTVLLTHEHIRQLGDRHFGIGFDQLLLVEAPVSPDNDFRYRIFNKDGSEVEQCGNGARCFARFVTDQHLTNKHVIRVETATGVIIPELLADNYVMVEMGIPQLNPVDIPFQAEQQAVTHLIEVDGINVEMTAVSMGNPHAIQIVPNVELAPVATQGAMIECHPRFPQRVNAGFMQVISRHEIRVRVYERGTGETLACGTGACAAVVAGILRGELDSRVTVAMYGGRLSVEWLGPGSPVRMTGPAITVFTGEIDV